MPGKVLGVTAMGGPGPAVVARIQEYEGMGFPAVWLTTPPTGLDALTIFAAAALRTERILLGTSIVPFLPRHPVVMAQQALTLAQLAPGRLRLGIGPSHPPRMQKELGLPFEAPLARLREYISILKALLRDGKADLDGRFYRVHAALPGNAPDVPVMASALRRASFEACGQVADGAITWLCPAPYLHQVALPALQQGAKKAGRPTPPLIVHAPVCVHPNAEEVERAVGEQMGGYLRLPFYVQMLTEAGFPQAQEGTWSREMVDAVVLHGPEKVVAQRLEQVFAMGADEVLAHPLPVGPDQEASLHGTLHVLADMARTFSAPSG